MTEWPTEEQFATAIKELREIQKAKREVEMFLVDEKTYLQLEKAVAAARVLLIDTEVDLTPTDWVHRCAYASGQLREAFAELDKLGYKPGEHK